MYSGFLEGERVDRLFADFGIRFAAGHWCAGEFFDRFCTSGTSDGNDTKRLYYVAGKLDLSGTTAQDWKLRVVTSGPVTVP